MTHNDRRCDYQVEYGTLGRDIRCGKRAEPGQPWCKEHLRDALSLHPRSPLPTGEPESQEQGEFTYEYSPSGKRIRAKKGNASGSTSIIPDLDPDATYALAVHAALRDLTIENLAQEWRSVAKAKSAFARDGLHERNWSLVNEYEPFVRKAHARGISAREAAKKIYAAQPGEKL